MGRSRLGNQALAVLNGFAGHMLARRRDALAIRTAVRVAGHDVPVAPRELATAFPGATARLAVLVHGLAETEISWTARASSGTEPGYGPRLRGELGYTPVYIRYNSGRHVSANGRLLGELLTELVGGWPVQRKSWCSSAIPWAAS